MTSVYTIGSQDLGSDAGLHSDIPGAVSLNTGYRNNYLQLTTDPTKSGIETSANGLYLYFYVGAVVQDASVIAAASVLTQIAELLSCDYVVESKVPTANDPTWYRVYKSGWVEQGGYYTISNSAFTSFNLLKEMADTNYTITGSSVSATTSVYPVNFAYLTTTTFNAKTGNASSGKFSWQVSGQGA
jgi:hypothetical protein